jgi:hypothetical protein
VAVAEGRSVTQALRGARSRRAHYCAPAEVLYRTRYPQNANARRKRLRGPDLPPRYARPIGGPRVPSSAAWHRLGCLLRGTTRPRLCAPVACLPGAGVPTQGTSHWGHPLGESNAPPGPMPVACLVADEDSLPLSWQHKCLQMYICMCTSCW